MNCACWVCELWTVLCVIELKQRDLLFILGEWSLTNNGQEEVFFKWGACGLSCQCGWGQKTLNPGADFPTKWQMEAVGLLMLQSLGLLSQCDEYLHTQLLKHISDVMEKLTVGGWEQPKLTLLVTILRRDMLLLPGTIHSLEQLSLVSYIRSCALAYRLKSNLWHISIDLLYFYYVHFYFEKHSPTMPLLNNVIYIDNP